MSQTLLDKMTHARSVPWTRLSLLLVLLLSAGVAFDINTHGSFKGKPPSLELIAYSKLTIIHSALYPPPESWSYSRALIIWTSKVRTVNNLDLRQVEKIRLKRQKILDTIVTIGII